MSEEKQTGIVGAGLVGSLLAVYMAKKGHRVRLYERRPDMRRAEISAGRSINLALSERGLKALEGVGLADEIRKIAIPMKGRQIHNEDGTQVFQPYGREGQFINSVSRGELNKKLMTFAEEKGVEIFFDQKIKHIDLENTVLHFGDDEAAFDLLFGADGAFSQVRLNMMLQSDRFNYSQDYLAHGYKELTIPPAEDGGWLIGKNALHIWPRHSFMLIALPNLDGSFTCTLFAPFEGENSFESIQNEEDLMDFFQCHFPDALEVMPTLREDYFSNPTSSLVTVRCFPWTIGDKVALIGDAAHAIVPFYGQGMNAGFEDCTVLNQMMDKYGDDWTTIFREYENERKPNNDAIADLAIRNFIEMRDQVADENFLLRKRVEQQLHERLPEQFIPMYSMVTFTHKPYRKAVDEASRQDAFFEKAFKAGLLKKNFSDHDVNKLVELWLKEYA